MQMYTISASGYLKTTAQIIENNSHLSFCSHRNYIAFRDGQTIVLKIVQASFFMFAHRMNAIESIEMCDQMYFDIWTLNIYVLLHAIYYFITKSWAINKKGIQMCNIAVGKHMINEPTETIGECVRVKHRNEDGI